MALRDVGGKSVYIIDAGTVDSAKTSAGTGYAQLVSQLRWQIWEASKQAVAQQLEFEKMGYQAQLDVFAKQQAELQRSLSKIRDIKNKVAAGVLDPKDALRLSIADANTELANERNELKAAGGGLEYSITETQAKTATGKPRVDENGNPVMIKSVRYKASEKGASAAGGAPTKGADAVTKPSDRYEAILAKYGGDADAAIDARAAEIQAELSGLKAPTIPTIDVIGRTRQGFGEMAGVGGFGFARRPTKSSPIYDEAKARRELFGAESDQNLDRTIKEMADNDYIETKARILSLDPERVLTPAEDLRLQQDALVRARRNASREFFDAGAVTSPVSARKFMTGDRTLRGPGGPDVPITEGEPKPEPPPAPAPRRGPPSPPQRDPAFQDFIDRVEDIDIDPYKAPPPPPAPPAPPARPERGIEPREIAELVTRGPIDIDDFIDPRTTGREIVNILTGPSPVPQGDLPGAAEAAADRLRDLNVPLDTINRGAIQDDLIFGGGVVPPESTGRPSDLEIFNEMLNKQDKTLPTDLPPGDPRAGERMPASDPSDPIITETDIEMAEDEDPEIYKKALDYWKTSPNKDIAADPPRYFSGKKPGEKVRPGEGQKEMVRRYLIEKAKQDRTKKEESLQESYLRYRDRPPINPDLARQSESQSQEFFQKASKTDPYIEQMDPTPEEKKELYDLYEAAKGDMGITSDREISDFYIQKLNEIRTLPKPVIQPKMVPKAEAKEGSLPKTRQQRAASYALNIIQKGKDLASKPEKLARIAKTNLPENERSKKIPEHIALVDKLYDINMSKGDVYKSTYSEIARVYEKQPKLRDAALEYLVAKNLLFGNIS
jgi:hypothetical protein